MLIDEPGAEFDTPINRATINQISVADLDRMLDEIRSRRLARVKKLEAAAKVKADGVQIVLYVKFEKAYKRALTLLNKMQEEEDKAEQIVNKVRAMVLEMEG